MRLSVATPLAIIVEADNVAHLRAEDDTGAFGILPGHADFLTALAVSVVSWRDVGGAEHHIAVIQHERIEGWMEAMTMEFPVADPAEYAKLKEGATIRARVNVNDAFFWLSEITVEQQP